MGRRQVILTRVERQVLTCLRELAVMLAIFVDVNVSIAYYGYISVGVTDRASLTESEKVRRSCSFRFSLHSKLEL